MKKHLPASMQAVIIPHYDTKRENLVLVEKAVPQPGPHEVLVQIAASPINPSDVMFLEGRYGVKKPLPVVPGFEASGRVVATGSGLLAKGLLGRRIACGSLNDRDGCWAQYMVTRADYCMPLLPHVNDEQGATALANPLTAWGLVDIARGEGHTGFVHNGASGAVGRMMMRLGQRFGLTVINVVRRAEQVALLHSLGAAHVLNSQEPTFEQNLRQLCRELNITIAFDAVAGEMSGQLVRAMPRKSKLFVYGALSNKACVINANDVIFGDKKVEGFWLTKWLPKIGLAKRLQLSWQVQRLLGTELETAIQARLPLVQAAHGLRLYTKNMTAGKVLFLPRNV